MALFEISTQEQSDMGLWLRSVKRELQLNTYTKSSFYGFDFIEENPSAKSKRFDWIDDESKFICGGRDLSTRPSSSIYHEDFAALFNSPDSLPEIPEIHSDEALL